MRTRFVCLLPLLLLACGPTDNSPQAQCRRQAYNEPAVKQAYGSAAFMTGWNGITGDAKVNAAVAQATFKCLQEKGLSPPGGVEPVERY